MFCFRDFRTVSFGVSSLLFLGGIDRGQPAAYQALGRVMDAAACCDKAKLPNFPDQALRTLVDVGEKAIGKPWENGDSYGKTMGKWWFNGGLMGFNGI